MTALYEKYRPAHWEEVCGQDAAVKRLRGMIARGGLAGQAFWLSGKSGTGKTTLARLIAAEVADDFGVEEIDAQWLTPARLRDMSDSMRIRGWGEKGGKCYIVNEAHGIAPKAVTELLTMIDPPPPHVAWVFTTTTAGQAAMFDGCIDAGPLMSRCVRFSLNQPDSSKAAPRLRQIAGREGLDGEPEEYYARLFKACDYNFRAALQAIESGQKLGERGTLMENRLI